MPMHARVLQKMYFVKRTWREELIDRLRPGYVSPVLSGSC